uniref:Potassium voltage-gated channel modifier subfamily S member 2 n=1 Tax=Callorhinchus milii TaxID=7868 RepID=A0A4W3GNF6_CALMI
MALFIFVHREVGDCEISVNVGGLKRKLGRHLLARYPETRLARLLSCRSTKSVLDLCDDYDASKREFYFDRNPALFPYVLNFYHTGRLHVMGELCVFSFSQEIEYWGINDLFIDSCCGSAYRGRKAGQGASGMGDGDMDDCDDTVSEQGSNTSSLDELLAFYRDASKYEERFLGGCRRQIWLMLENPGYNVASRVYSALSILGVVGSIANVCLNSMPEFQLAKGEARGGDDPRFEIVEHFCIAWFTLELLVRLWVSPGFLSFFRLPLNLIDLLSISPFYLTLLVKMAVENTPALTNLGRAVQVLRLMRIFRVLKLARHSTGLRSLGATLKHSYREVGLLLLYLSVGVSVFSALAYTVEKEENPGLSTIPTSWWWATVSMTTVGYGDVVPASVGGKLTASACILAGILVVVLPITLIFNKFSHFYRRQRKLEDAVRSCQFEQGLTAVPVLNLRDYYADRMKSLMASLSDVSRGASSDSGDDSLQ